MASRGVWVARLYPTLDAIASAEGVWHGVAATRISTRQFTGTKALEGGMADRTDHPIHFQQGPTRRAFLEAGALALLGLAAPPLALPAAAQTPKRGGTLVIAADVSPPGLDPQKSAAAHSWMISEHVYSNLLRRDPKMNVVGDLAESWHVLAGKRGAGSEDVGETSQTASRQLRRDV